MADEIAAGIEPAAEKPKYDQAFFLALAARGKDAWNAWRHDPANKDVRVTFAEVDFRTVPWDETDFSGFEFGDHAAFTHAAFGGQAKFIGSLFGDFADFIGTIFGDGADFTAAGFGNHTNFNGVVFSDHAKLTRALFGDFTNLAGMIFGDYADFTGIIFGDFTDFTGTIFNDFADFREAAFGKSVHFFNVTFKGFVRFAGAAFGSDAAFSRAIFEGEADFSGMSKEQWIATLRALFNETASIVLNKWHEESWQRHGSGPDRFLAIRFSRARFLSIANFSERLFEKSADFSGARFYYAPILDWTANFARFDFTGAKFGLHGPSGLDRIAGTELPSLLRTMRKAAEEARDHDFERNLYILERKSELGINWDTALENLKSEGWKNWLRNAVQLIVRSLWIVVMGLYSAFADYGRSFARPFAWLIASGFFFYWCFSMILAPLAPKACPLGDQYDHAVRMLALGNTVPFIGPLTIDSEIKKFLFCPDGNCPGPIIPPEGYQLLVLTQNLLSIILVFFIGLALRNYFKIK